MLNRLRPDHAVRFLAAALCLLSAFELTSGTRAFADTHFPIHPSAQLSWVSANPSSAHGGEGGFSLLLEPFEGRWVNAGPRVTYLIASGDQGLRRDLNLGAEGIVWLMKAIGTGGGVDYVKPIGNGLGKSHARIEGITAIRFLHAGEDGAWAARLGVVYDRDFQWAVKLGISLQLSGVEE